MKTVGVVSVLVGIAFAAVEIYGMFVHLPAPPQPGMAVLLITVGFIAMRQPG